ncbi:hypothetical protein GOP47_0016982 [Adiantum capillus-veneris]|uniref:Uncharacterized protein n=1 Tax=Adiantum capillus-veneris TaxID=13818 RepID=A0A9D4UJE4_ADICA|nr:hypothetical protein GOP47_0016982 [Adiantum capillus-veneris]
MSQHSEELGVLVLSNSSNWIAEEHVYPIFRVPSPLRSIAPPLFTPQVLAMGPLHSPAWNPNIPPSLHSTYTEMDHYKLLSWQKIFKEDVPEQEAPFLHFLHQHKDIMLASYGGRIEKEYDAFALENHFVNRLALDACFIAALLHSLFQENFPYLKEKMAMEEIIMVSRVCTTAHIFPIYSRTIGRPVQKAILQDLLLVENQVPLIAVKQAVKIESKCRSDEEAERILELYVAALAHRVLPFSRSRRTVLSSVKNASSGAHHLMDMMYSIVCMHSDPSSEGVRYQNVSKDPHVMDMPGANRIHVSGVKFHGHWGSLNELSFSNGRLFLPKIHVSDDTERYFRNLIAYETCFKTERLDLVSYLHFMDFLIDTPADVGLLVESKIITEAIGSDAKVAEMWNSLCRNTMCVFSPKYKAVADSIQSYCRSPWRMMWAEFYRSKLSKPWLVASLLSAAALLIMTLLILWYTILLYHHETS